MSCRGEAGVSKETPEVKLSDVTFAIIEPGGPS
jgi:hypothetical protein